MKKSEKAKGKERAAAKKKMTLYYTVAVVALFIIVAVALFFALNPVVAKVGDTVAVLYVGTLQNGSVFDSNLNTTLNFTIGAHRVIPGFENAVIGMSKDQVKTINIPVDQAYGPYRDDLVFSVNRSFFSAETPPQIGMYYLVTNPTDGSQVRVKVVNFTSDTVTIDQNHMLAGQNLTYMIRLVGITSAK